MDREKNFKLKAEVREYAKKLISLEQFIRTIMTRQFLKQTAFLTYFWRFLSLNSTSEQLKLEKIVGI